MICATQRIQTCEVKEAITYISNTIETENTVGSDRKTNSLDSSNAKKANKARNPCRENRGVRTSI